MADEQIVFNVVADYDKAIKEWEQLRDAVATTTKEYTEANQEIEKLRIAKGEFTGVAYKSKRAIEQEKQALRQSNLEYKRREKELNEVFKAQEQNTSSVKKLTKVQLQQKDATGATTSAALELGRVVSDAPYGIRGMANNLTQLVSQMAFATKAAGGFRLALKGLWTSLMGPLGVVLAITAAISALDFFYGSQKKAKDETAEHNDELERQAGLLRELNSILEVLSVSSDAISLDWIDSFVAGVDEINKKDLLKILERDIKGITNAFDKLPKEEQNIRGIEVLVEKRKTLLESITKEKELKEELNELEKEFSVYRFLPESETKTSLSNEIVEKQKELLALQKSIVDIQDLFRKGSKPKGKKSKKRPTADILEDIYGIDISPEAQAKYIEKLTEMFDFSSMSLTTAPELDLKLSEETQQGIDNYNKEVVRRLNLMYDLEEYEEYANRAKDMLSGISDFINAESERELAIEQNKTTALNEELNNRLLNEKLSADQRKAIQNQIWQNDEALRKKQNEIKKKQFNTEKAFNISTALIETYAAASSAFRNTLANPINKLDPTAGLLRAKINAGIAVAGGLLQVAAISRQKFQPTSASTPINTASGGGGGGGVGDRSFDFNLVGNTQENQLANAIQSQFSTPLQAFVVSKDITTQQELDLNIKSSATF